MMNMISATLYRIRKSTAAKVCFGLTTVATILYTILSTLVADGTLDASVAGSLTALGDAMIIWLFASVMAGVIICQDFNSKAIHMAVQAKHGRVNIIAAYSIVFFIITLLLSFPYLISSVVCIAADISLQGAESIIISNYLMNLTIPDVSLGKAVLLYLANGFIYAGSLSVCLPIAVKVKKPVVITAVGFMFGMLIALLSSLVEKSEVISAIIKATPFGYTMENLNIDSSIGTILLSMLVSVAFAVLMFGLSILIFRKQEIK